MPISSADGTGRPAAVLRATGVVVGYGGPPVVSGVDLQVGSGEVATIVGPNGAGKSTLIKAMAGVLRMSEGRTELHGRNVTNWQTDRLARHGVGYVPQTSEVFGDLSVIENLEMGGYLVPRRSLRGRIGEVVDVFPPLRALLHRRADRLSGGERKMVAIGRALVAKPDLLLLDEPTAGLSAALSRQVLETQVTGLGQLGVAVLMVEQKAHTALAVSQWGYVLATGRLRISSTAGEILARPDLGSVFLGDVVAG